MGHRSGAIMRRTNTELISLYEAMARIRAVEIVQNGWWAEGLTLGPVMRWRVTIVRRVPSSPLASTSYRCCWSCSGTRMV